MTTRLRNDREFDRPVFKYVMWFFAGLFIVGIPIGILQEILPGWLPLQALLGLGMIFGAAEFARWRFGVDHGRGFSPSERFRMFVASEVVLFLFLLLGLSLMIQMHNSGPFAFRKIPMGFALLGAIGATVVYALPLWLSYWIRNGSLDAADAAESPARAAPRAPVNVMVIGSGGREHALAWKLAQSPRVAAVVVAPGNAGTARERKCRNVAVDIKDIDALVQLARREHIGITVVGPEGPLVAGVVDRFRAEGLRIFGPTAAAAQLEGSKAFAKDFLARHAIPTAHYAVHTDVDAALAYIREKGAPIVVKADGLAAGKGVSIVEDYAQAEAAVKECMVRKRFGDAGKRLLIEDFLQGEEISVHAITDGHNILPLCLAQDHKRVGDGDSGENTGGMGTYSPLPQVEEATSDQIQEEIIVRSVHAMNREEVPFRGTMFVGVMLTKQGPRVLEYNVRFGDPETQTILARLKGDLFEILSATVDGKLDQVQADWDERTAVTVVLASGGYPRDFAKGYKIHGLEYDLGPDVMVFHAGTKKVDGEWFTNGGRVLSVTALGQDLQEARAKAYAAIEKIRFDKMIYRKDIGWRGMK